jgi:ankyrin repeat protein
MEAARDGKGDVARLLIERGANVRQASAANGLAMTALHLATAAGSKELVELLVAKGADINARDLEGATPLLWATNQQPDTAVLLVKLGANSDIAPKEGDAPRVIAQKRNMAALLEAMGQKKS